MSDRPILFSAPMVRAILREIEVPGTGKTQTRRILKPQPYHNGFHFNGRDILCHIDELPPSAILMDKGRGKNRYIISNLEDGPEGMAEKYVGDRLWVREPWRAHKDHDVISPRDLLDWQRCVIVSYDANGDQYDWLGKRRPGMFMPRWASRITLEVTDVRVERLQDISEEDAKAEGAEGMPTWGSYRNGFNAIWIDINGVDSWNKNPWVSAITFRPHLCNIDAFVPALSSGLEVREVEG